MTATWLFPLPGCCCNICFFVCVFCSFAVMCASISVFVIYSVWDLFSFFNLWIDVVSQVWNILSYFLHILSLLPSFSLCPSLSSSIPAKCISPFTVSCISPVLASVISIFSSLCVIFCIIYSSYNPNYHSLFSKVNLPLNFCLLHILFLIYIGFFKKFCSVTFYQFWLFPKLLNLAIRSLKH